MYIFVFLMGKRAVCWEVRTGPLDVIQMNFMFEKRALPWLRQLVADLPPRRTGFDFGPNHVSFVVNKVAKGQDFFFEYFCFPCLPVLPTCRSINITLTRRASGRSRRTLNQITALSDIGKYWTENCLYIVHA